MSYRKRDWVSGRVANDWTSASRTRTLLVLVLAVAVSAAMAAAGWWDWVA